MTRPVSRVLDRQLDAYARRARIPVLRVASEHFYAERQEVRDMFGARCHWLLDGFYRRQRQKHQVLLDDHGKPLVGRWCFDADNRKPWRGQPPEPEDAKPKHDHGSLWQTI